MPIAMTCPSCRKAFQMPDHLRGKTVRCKDCKQTFVVGAPAGEEREPEQSPKAPSSLTEAMESPGYRLSDKDRSSRRRRGHHDDDDDDRPPWGTAIGLLLRGGGVGGGLLAVGLVLAFLLSLRAPPPPGPEVQAVAPPSTIPTNNPAPRQPSAPPQQPKDNGPKFDFPPPPPPEASKPPGLGDDWPFGDKKKAALVPQPPLVWKVLPDPLKEIIKLPDDAKKVIPVPPNQEPLFPSTPSTSFAVGTPRGDAIQVWDLQTLKTTGAIRGRFPLAPPFALSPDGNHVAGRAAPPTQTQVEVWSFKTGKKVRGYAVDPLPDVLNFLDFAGPNQLLTSKAGAKGDVLQVWDFDTDAPVREINGPPRPEKPERGFDNKKTQTAMQAAALSPGRKYLAMAANDHLLVYDLAKGELVGDLVLPIPDEFFKLFSHVPAACQTIRRRARNGWLWLIVRSNSLVRLSRNNW